MVVIIDLKDNSIILMSKYLISSHSNFSTSLLFVPRARLVFSRNSFTNHTNIRFGKILKLPLIYFFLVPKVYFFYKLKFFVICDK